MASQVSHFKTTGAGLKYGPTVIATIPLDREEPGYAEYREYSDAEDGGSIYGDQPEAGRRCNCCPYGYHIDLDFLNFNESVNNGNNLANLRKVRRNKRKLRKSMEVYLNQQEHANNSDMPYAPPPDVVHSSEALYNLVERENDAASEILEEIDSDVNNTLNHIDQLMQKKGKAYHHSYDESYHVTPSPQFGDNSYVSLHKPNIQMRTNNVERSDSLTSISSQSTLASDTSAHLASAQLAANLKYLQQPEVVNDNVVDGVNADALRLIREQMATSLERLKELEEQVKTIPVLQVRISVLKEEKRLLMLQLKAKNNKLNQRTVGVGDGTINPLVNSGFGDKDVHKDYRGVHERELQTEQNEFKHEKEIHTLLLGKEDRFRRHKEPPPVKPKTRTIGTGDGDVFDVRSNVHVHERELRTVIIGQEVDKRTRNVGILCKAPMRDVGVHFMSDLEKPLMKSIAVGVGEGTLELVPGDNHYTYASLNQMNLAAFQSRNVNIDPAALRGMLDDMLKKDLRSESTQTSAASNDKSVQFEGVVEKVTVGCSQDTIDVVISPYRKTRSIAIDCRPGLINRSTLTEKIYRMDTATNTVKQQPIHRSTNTHPPVTYPANVGTDPIVTRDTGTDVEQAIFKAQSVIKTTAVNTDRPMLAECGLNTEITSLKDDLDTTFQNNSTVLTTTTRTWSSGSPRPSWKSDRQVVNSSSTAGHRTSPDRFIDDSLSRLEKPKSGTQIRLTRHVETTYPKDKQADSPRTTASGLHPDDVIEYPASTDPRGRRVTVTETRVERVAGSNDNIKSIMKKPGSNEGVNRKKEITFSEEVTGGYVTSSSEGDLEDAEEEEIEDEEEDKSEEASASDASFDEGSYDGRLGRITYSCDDDEKLRDQQNIPDQNIRETFDLSSELRGACETYATWLQDSTRISTKQLNPAMNLIQLEWFKTSSHKLSKSAEVEDYLNSFSEISKDVLEHVINMADANGNTALHYAVSHCNMDIVNLLLDTKVCNCNFQNKAGYTALMLASLAQIQTGDQTRALRRLFSEGDVNAHASVAGQTALMLAVSHGRADMVRLLVEAKADVNAQDEDGSTALMCASEHGHLEIVKQLLANPDIDIGLKDNDGSTALSIALEAGHREVGLQLYARLTFNKGGSPGGSSAGVSENASVVIRVNHASDLVGWALKHSESFTRG